MKINVIRKKAIILNSIKRFFYINRFCFISLFLVFFIGIITGIFVAFKKADYLTCDILEKFILYRFLSKDISLIFFIIEKLLFVFIISAICCLLSRFKFSIICFNIFVFFLSYYLGLLVATLIVLYGVVGIVNVLLVVLPFELIIYSFLIFYMVWLFDFNKCSCFKRYQFNELLKRLLVFICLVLFIVIIEGIIIKLLTNSIIFVI